MGEWLPAQVTTIGAENGLPGERRLAVRLSLAPGQVRQIHFMCEPAPTTATPFTLSESEVHGTRCCIIANSRLTVAVPCAMSFAAGAVPGALVAVRRAADKTWVGQGSWGPADCCGRLETDMLDQGPLFVRWCTRYLLGGRECARYEMTLFAGEDFVLVREATALDAGEQSGTVLPGRGMAFRFLLTGADAPQYWCSHGGGEQVKVLRGPLSAPPPRMGSNGPAPSSTSISKAAISSPPSPGPGCGARAARSSG